MQYTRDMKMQSLNTTEISLGLMTSLGSKELIEYTFKPVYDDDHHAFQLK